MMFYIEAKVKIRVAGISGPWEKTVVYLVDAPTLGAAKQKYEAQVKQDNLHMEARSFEFEYQKVGPQI